MGKKWLAQMVIGLVLLAVAFGGGYTVALFSDTTENVSSTYVAGTVQLSEPVVNLLDIANMLPGHRETQTYAVTYEGSVEAWLGLDTTLAGDLTTCDGAGHLTVAIQDGTGHPYVANALDQVIARVTPGTTVTFTVEPALDLATGNACQGKSGIFGMLVKAVQAEYNTLPDGTGPIAWNETSELDQSSGPLDVSTHGADQIPWAQTFTAGRTGLLDKVEIYLHGPADLDVVVSIRTVDGSGQPTDTVLASATIPAGSLASVDTLVPVIFASPAPVTAGTTYAIYRTPLVSSGWSWNAPVGPDSYSEGQAWADRRADLGYWESYTAYDLPFRTYVN